MRFLVFSDTHRRTSSMERVIKEQIHKTNALIHLGDLAEDAVFMKQRFPQLPVLYVGGNNDFCYPIFETVLELGDKRVMLAHGHNYGVKSGYERIIQAARKKKCDILLFGHTHVAYQNYEDGLFILNPGSPTIPMDGKPSYGVLDITQKGIMAYPIFL